MNDRRSFLYLWTSQMMANAGDVLYIVGLIQLVYISTGSILTLALIPLAITCSRLMGSLITPLLLQRFPLQSILRLAMFGKILALSAVFLMKEEAMIWIIFLVGINAFLDGWTAPIRQAMLPEFAGKSELRKANSLISITDNAVNLASWPLGALFVSLYGGGPLILLAISLYILSSFLTLGIKAIPHKRSEKQPILAQLTSGWRFSFSIRPIRNILILDTLAALGGAVWISAILYVYVEDILGKSEAWWGYINALYSGGFVVGGYLFYKLNNIPVKWLVIIGSTLTGLLTIWFIYPVYAVMALVLSLLLGIVGQLQAISQLSILQTQTETEKLGYVFSVQEVIVTGAFGAATLLFGWIAENYGIESAFFVSAMLSVAGGIFALIEKSTLDYGLEE